MMRIIDNKVEEKVFHCSNCGCKIGYTEYDVHITGTSKPSIQCPRCHAELFVKTFDRPFNFPNSFSYYSENDRRIIEVNDEDIEDWIKFCVKKCLEENKDYYHFDASNIIIDTLKENGEIYVTVTKNCYRKRMSEEEAKKLINANGDNSTMKLFFLEGDKKIFLGEFSTEKDIWKKIYGYCEEKGITIPYVRLWNENDAIKIDYGSWSDFFVIEGNIENF